MPTFIFCWINNASLQSLFCCFFLYFTSLILLYLCLNSHVFFSFFFSLFQKLLFIVFGSSIFLFFLIKSVEIKVVLELERWCILSGAGASESVFFFLSADGTYSFFAESLHTFQELGCIGVGLYIIAVARFLLNGLHPSQQVFLQFLLELLLVLFLFLCLSLAMTFSLISPY